MNGAELIAAERERQINVKGFDARLDGMWTNGQLATAASAYALHSVNRRNSMPPDWPWTLHWWKPSTPIRDLVRAGALIAAEIDRRLAAGEVLNGKEN